MAGICPQRRAAPAWLLKLSKGGHQTPLPGADMLTTTPARLSAPQDEHFHFFFDDGDISDDVHHRVFVSRLEMDVINTPEFRRLFQVSQLGFVSLLYPTANHTRGTHSIGVCGLAKYLVSKINDNIRRIHAERSDNSQLLQISETSSLLIALGALLHDLSHGPLSHDIEKKTHKLSNKRGSDERLYSFRGPYSKHDDLEKNPVLRLMLTDRDESILARVLHVYSRAFCKFMWLEAETNEAAQWELKPLIETIEEVKKKNPTWDYEQELLPQLLLHLLAGERWDQFDKDGRLNLATKWGKAAKAEPWGLGPTGNREASRKLHQSWYQPFRYDIIGNTLSADLLDYLARDTQRLGLPCNMDDRFLNYIVLERLHSAGAKTMYCCALDITDYKRGVARLGAMTDVFQLLDIRFDIHKKAILHRVVQAAVAMMWRTIALLEEKKPKENDLYDWPLKPENGLGRERALSGDNRFLTRLLAGQDTSARDAVALKLATKVIERRLYKPLLVIPGDAVPNILSADQYEERSSEETARELAALVDSRYFDKFFRTIERSIEDLLTHAFDFTSVLENLHKSAGAGERVNFLSKRVIFWVLPYKQLYKDPLIRISFQRTPNSRLGPTPLEEVNGRQEWGENLLKLLQAGIQDADAKYCAAWSASVFISDGLFYTGILAKANPDVCKSLDEHEEHLKQACVLAVASLRTAWSHWTGLLRESRQRWLDDIESGNDKIVHPLDDEPTSETMELLLRTVAIGDVISNAKRVTNDMPSVTFSQYLHENPTEGILRVPENCRDVRYKFDFDRLLAPNSDPQFEKQLEGILGVIHDEATQNNLTRLLKAMNENAQLTYLEAEEIADRFANLPQKGAENILAPLSSSGTASREDLSELVGELLCALWRET